MKRIFAAVDISDDARRRAAEYISDLRNEFPSVRAGWEKAEKLHLTLKFLGDVDDTELQNFIGAVEETVKRIAPFDLRIAGTGVFPSKQRARVLWLGVVDEKGNLRRLNEILETESERKNLRRETRIFKPHLTIARLREPSNSARLTETHLNNGFQSNEFSASGITIYESVRQKSGSVYSVISKRKLKQDGQN